MKKTNDWGNFLPQSLSCFAYNETSAHDYFPLSKEEALSKGYTWLDSENAAPQPQTISLPDKIDEVSEDITKETLQCESCNKNFRIVVQEYKFYKNLNLPIPHLCHNCRHQKRTSLRNPRKLWDRECQKCGIDIRTSYAPERPEAVYCERCYLEEVN